MATSKLEVRRARIRQQLGEAHPTLQLLTAQVGSKRVAPVAAPQPADLFPALQRLGRLERADEQTREKLHQLLAEPVAQLRHDLELASISAGGVAPESAVELLLVVAGDLRRTLAKLERAAQVPATSRARRVA